MYKTSSLPRIFRSYARLIYYCLGRTLDSHTRNRSVQKWFLTSTVLFVRWVTVGLFFSHCVTFFRSNGHPPSCRSLCDHPWCCFFVDFFQVSALRSYSPCFPLFPSISLWFRPSLFPHPFLTFPHISSPLPPSSSPSYRT